MGVNFVNGLLAGVTAAVIWIGITLVVGMDTKTIGLWALILLVIGTVGTTIISSVISRAKGSVQRT